MARNKSTAAYLILLIALLAAAGFALFKFQDLEDEKKADALIQERRFREAAAIVSEKPYPFLLARQDDRGAGALYLRTYFLEFGRDYLGAHDAQTAALAKGDTATACALNNLSNYAIVLDDNLNLAVLAEHYVRCAASVARAGYKAAQGKSAAKNQFARTLLRLAQIYEKHQKFQIAEKAYQESVATAGAASDGAPNNTDTLKNCLDAYILFLGRMGRSEEAVTLLKERQAID